MIHKLLKIYMVGFTLIMLAALFALPNILLFLSFCYFVLFGMGMAILFIKNTFKDFIVDFIICFIFVALAMFGVYKTSDLNATKTLLILVVPILVSSYQIMKADVKFQLR